MKRIFCLMMAFCMILMMIPAAVAQERVAFRLESERGAVGDEVSVTVKVENLPASASYDIILQYDPAVLEPTAFEKQEAVGMASANLEYTYEGQAAVKVSGLNINDPSDDRPAAEGNATLFAFKFRILAETPGDFGTLVKTARAYFATAQFQQNPIDRIYNTCVLVGDDAGDSTAQAILIMQKLIGMEVEADAALLDRSGDGVLTIADAVILLRELNGRY